MSPVLQAAVEERLAEMSSRQSATAAIAAQRAYKMESKQPNIHDPWREVEAFALTLLVGVYLNLSADGEYSG